MFLTTRISSAIERKRPHLIVRDRRVTCSPLKQRLLNQEAGDVRPGLIYGFVRDPTSFNLLNPVSYFRHFRHSFLLTGFATRARPTSLHHGLSLTDPSTPPTSIMASNETASVSNSAPALYESGLTIPSDSEIYSANHDATSTSSDSPLILYRPSTTLWSIVRGAAINLVLPFVNGLMLGFGELFAHEAAFRLGWSGTKVFLVGTSTLHL